jgi:hypothetical protein
VADEGATATRIDIGDTAGVVSPDGLVRLRLTAASGSSLVGAVLISGTFSPSA